MRNDLAEQYSNYVTVTPADEDLPDGTCRALLVAVAGTASLMTPAGAIVHNVSLVVGRNPLMCKQVRTGGSADGITALY